MLVSLSIVIPTYRREKTLIDTIGFLLELRPKPLEILIVDQTARHRPEVEEALVRLEAEGNIRRITLDRPSIPFAMNCGLRRAKGEFVLFLDDDIVPEPSLIAAHLTAHERWPDALVAGRVIQPWQVNVDFSQDATFHFASLRPVETDQFMGGNFSVRRRDALEVGGFDENFVGVAYRFEAEFAYRWLQSGRRIRFEPAACLRHLKVTQGGTRSYGEHLKTWRPYHSVGEYYFLLRTWKRPRSFVEIFARPARAIMTRFHLRHPWRIPATLISEVLGLIWALRLFAGGAALLDEKMARNDV